MGYCGEICVLPSILLYQVVPLGGVVSFFRVYQSNHMWCHLFSQVSIWVFLSQPCFLDQVLAYSVTCAGVSAFNAGLIDAVKAEEIMSTLRTLTEESQQV